jgi:LacI family transcriptional regulator
MHNNSKRVGQPKPATIQDVAKLAGVSKSTVSRVINASGPVNTEVEARVRAVIANLNYNPNSAARALSSNHSVFIGLVIGDIENPFTISLLRGVEEEVRRNKYLLIICGSHPNLPLEEQLQYVETLASAPVAGAIINPVQQRMKALDIFKARNIPIVTIDHQLHDASVDSVRIDNVAAAMEAIEHLIANGYRRIGIVNGPHTSTTANERLLGYRQALAKAGISCDAALEHRGSYIETTAVHATRKFLELDEPVDAIFATNNRLTVGVVRTLANMNKRMPEDVALVGFDQINWDASMKVSITTVMQPSYDIGRTAVRTLMQQLQEPGTLKHDIILPHRLVIRNSSRSRSSVALPEVHFEENFGS